MSRPPIINNISPDNPALKRYYENLAIPSVSIYSEPSQYDKGLLPNMDIEELRAGRQSSLDKFGNGLAGMASSATTGALEATVGFAYGITAAAINQDSEKIWKNDFTDNIITPLTDWTREVAPFYYSQAEKDAAWYQGALPGTAGSANFWFDKVFNGAGYTIGSLAAGYGLGKLFGLSKAAASGRLISDAASAEQVLQKGVTASQLFKETLPMAKQFGIGMVMAHGESALESRETYEGYILQAERLREAGDPAFIGKTDEEIQSLAKDAANSNYIMNLAITGPTDMILLGRFINPGTKASIREYNRITRTVDDAGKLILKDATLDNSRRALVNGGEAFLKGAFPEALQEGGQFASNIASQQFVNNYVLGKQDWLEAVVGGMAEGIDESLSSKEGLQSILIGGIVGGPFGLKGAKSERIAREANTKKRIEVQMSDPEFVTGGSKMANFLLANNALNASEEAKKNKDLFEANNKESFALGKYVQAYIETDQTDILKARLESLKQAPDTDAAQFFGFEETKLGDKNAAIDKILTRINRFEKMHENIQRMYGLSQGTPEQIAENQWLKNALYEASFTLDNIEERETSMGKALTQLTGSAELDSARKRMILAHKMLTSENMEERYEEYDKAAEDYNKKLEKVLGLKATPTERIDYQEYRDLLLDEYRKEYNNAVQQLTDKYPLVSDEILETLADLNKLAEKREQVISYINDLRNPKARGATRNFQKEMLKSIMSNEKAKRDAAKEGPLVTTEQEAAEIINNVGTQDRSKPTVTPGGEELDIAKIEDQDLVDLYNETQKELSNLDPQSPEYATKLEYASALNEEIKFREEKQSILKDLQTKYRNANTAAEKAKVIAEARALGFPINEEKFQRDLDKLSAQVSQAKEQEAVSTLDAFFQSMFKGPREFQEVVTRTEDPALFEELLATENFYDYLALDVDRFQEKRRIPFGSAEKGTEHPKLAKQASEFSLVVTFKGKPLGFITFYDTFIDKVTGAPIPIETMTQQQYQSYFGNNPEYPLAEFKKAYSAAKAFHDYVTSDKFLKGGNFGTVSNAELLGLVVPHLTTGRFKYVQVGQDFVPLSEFTLYRNAAGKSLIVDTARKEETDLSQNEKINTYNTSQTDAYSVEIPAGAPEGTLGQRVVKPELVDAFKDLHRIKTETRAYSRYWALVEQPGGPIKINGVSYRWTALTPSTSFTDGVELMKQLNEALVPGADPGTKEGRKAISDAINNKLFIAFGDNGSYASDFRLKILPNYKSKDKQGKERKAGYSLSISSPTFFKNKPQEGTIQGVRWQLNEDKTTMFLNIEGMVGTFDQLIEEFENRRAVLSRAGGPLVGTTALTVNAFKTNPSTSTQSLSSVQDLESKLASTTEPKNSDQKLIFRFNEAVLIPDYKPAGSPPPAATQPAPVANKKAEIERNIKADLEQLKTIPPSNYIKVRGNEKDLLKKFREYLTDVLGWERMPIGFSNGNLTLDYLGTELKIPASVTVLGGDTSILDINVEDVINAKYDAELTALKPTAPAVVTGNVVKEVIGDAAYNEFINTGNVNDSIINSIASKIKQGVQLTPREVLIYQAKASDIEAVRTKLATTVTAAPVQSAAKGTSSTEEIEQAKRDLEALIAAQKAQSSPGVNPIDSATGPQTNLTGVLNTITSTPIPTGTQFSPDNTAGDIPVQFDNTQSSRPGPPAAFSRVERSTLTEEERINLATAFANLRKILPSWITAEELDALEANIINGVTTLGYFNNNIIKLFAAATVGTEYHEAFHAVFRTMLTNTEQNNYYAIAKKELREQLAKEGKSYVKHKQEYLKLTPEAATLLPEVVDMLILEEYMAEKFKDYMNNKGKKTFLQRLFEKIKNLFRFTQTSELDTLFAQIEKGKFKNAVKVNNRFDTSAYGHAPAYNNIFLHTDPTTGNHRYLDSATQTVEVNKIASLVLDIIEEQLNKTAADETGAYDNDNVEEVILKVIEKEGLKFNPQSSVAQTLLASKDVAGIKRYQDLIYLYTNQASIEELASEVMKTLNKYNVDETTLDVTDTEFSDDSPERNYDKNQEQIGGFGSLSKKLKKKIALTVYEVTLNQYLGTNIEEFEGIPVRVAVDPKKVYNGLSKITANQADKNKVLDIMADQLDTPGEMSQFIARFFESVGIKRDPVTGKADLSGVKLKDEAEVQMVATAFNLWNVDYYFASVDPAGPNKKKDDPRGSLIEPIKSNVRDVDTVQVESWANNYDMSPNDKTAKKTAIQNVITLLSEDVVSFTEQELVDKALKIKSQARIAGLDLSVGYIKYLLLANPNLQVKPERQLSRLNLYKLGTDFTQTLEHLQALSYEMDKANPFRREEKKDAGIKGAVTRAKDIARDNAIFDESVEPSTFINAEGKMIYGLQTDTFTIRKMFEIATSEDWTYEELQKKAEQDPMFEYLLDNYLLTSKNWDAIRSTLKVTRIDGLRERSIDYKADTKENKINIEARVTEGVTYGRMTDREFALLQYILYASTKETVYANGKVISKRPVLLTVMESGNTADTVSLEIINAVDPETGTINDSYLESLYKELEREHRRIKSYQNGKFNGVRILNYNYGPVDKHRAAKFWADNQVILESIYGDMAQAKMEEMIEAQDLSSFKEELKTGLNAWLEQEIDDHIDELVELGILRKGPNGALQNILLPAGYSNTFEKDNPNQLFVTDNLRTNIKQTYLSNMLNNLAANQMLEGDPALTLKDFIDKFKRDKGRNASGRNTSLVTFRGVKKTSFNFATYITPDFDEIKSDAYALGPTKIVPVYKKNSTEFSEEFLELKNELTEDQLKKALKDGKIAVADAQGYGSTELFREIYSSLGRMTERGHTIYDKIAEGKEITAGDQRYLAENQIMMNSLKMVYYDGNVYLKLSIAPLQKSQTSRRKKVTYTTKDGKSYSIDTWVAQKGKEWLHDMRSKMEDGPTKIHLMGPPSMSKKMIKNPVMLNKDNSLPNIYKEEIQVINRDYFRLQQENPSNKLNIKDPTQLLKVLSVEQDPSVEVILPNGKKMTIGQINEMYSQVLGMRVTEFAKFTKSFISEVKQGVVTPKLKRLVSIFKETLEQSGASDKLLSILETTPSGTPIYNINLPDVVSKFEEMFNAHFNKIFSQKIAGYKTTLQSGFGHNIIFDKSTGKIITNRQYLADPDKYETAEYGTRELAFDQPRYDAAGNIIGRYAEIILPFHFAEQFGLRPGDEIPEEIAYMLGVRIPTQDKHSAMALKIVDILPAEMGSNAIFPKELIILTGSDFDIDSFYIHRVDHYVKKDANGRPKFMAYGNTEDSAFQQYVLWHTKNNPFVASIVKAEKKSNSSLAQTFKEAKKLEKQKKTELRERYKERQEILDYLDNPEDSVLPILTGRAAEKEILEDIKAVRKELEPITKLVEQIEERFVKYAMQELDMPTTEEAFNKEKPANIGALNNELLDYKTALLTNEHIRKEIGLTPATLRQIKDEVLPEIMQLLGYQKDGLDYGKKKVTFSISGLIKAFSANKAGSIAIGAAVNATQQYATFSKFGLPLIGEGVKIDGLTTAGIVKDKFKASETKSKEGGTVRIMDTLSTATSSMTDNSKYLFNKLLNLGLETLGVVSYGVQQGVPLKQMVLLINNEYVVRLLKQTKSYNIQTLDEQDKSVKATQDGLIEELIQKIKEYDPEVKLNDLLQEELTYEELTKYLPYSSLGKAYSLDSNKETYYSRLESAVIPGFSIIDYYKAQYKMLMAYIKLNDQQIFLNKTNALIKMTKGISGAENDRSFSADDQLLQNLEDMNIKVVKQDNKLYFTHIDPRRVDAKKAAAAGVSTVPFDLLPIIQNDPLLRANLTEFFEKQDIAKKVFVSKTEFVEKAKTIVNNNIRKVQTAVRRKALRSFRRNLESYLNSLAFRKWWATNMTSPMPDFGGLLYKELAEKGNTLKDKIDNFVTTYPEMRNNLFFKLINYKESETTGFMAININTRNQKEFAGKVLDAFDTLFNHSAEGRALANELFFYEMARNSLQFKNNSFVSYIPNHRFKIISDNIQLSMDALNTMDPTKFNDRFGATKQQIMLDFMDRFFTDINNSRAVFALPVNKRTSAYAFVDSTTNELHFPVVDKIRGYTEDEARIVRNSRHDDLGAIDTKDGNRSTSFPLYLKYGPRKTRTLYRLKSINGVAIENIDFLTGTAELGNFNGASAVYEPVTYSGSNVDNFITYSMTKEEKERVTEHLQRKLAAKQVNAAQINEDANAAMSVPTGSEDITNDLKALQIAQQAAESAVKMPTTGLGGLLKPFDQSELGTIPGETGSMSMFNPAPLPASIKANPSPENKAVLNEAQMRQQLAEYYMQIYNNPTVDETTKAKAGLKISLAPRMSFELLVEEYNKMCK
jgi:hypothetical protein